MSPATCPVHPGAPDYYAVHQGEGRPRSRFFEIARRISERFEPATAQAFLEAIEHVKDSVDLDRLRSAVAGGSLPNIEAAAGAGRLAAVILGGEALQSTLAETSTVTGHAATDILEDLTGVTSQFNARHPNVVLFARTQTAELVAQVSDDVKEAIRIAVASGSDLGLNLDQQARAIRGVIGLRPGHVSAPENLARDLREGLEASATSRRLDAVSKQRIRSRIRSGTVTPAFVEEMKDRYRFSLLNYRAQSIARTETHRAANAGQHEAWGQAARDGVIPQTAKRVAIVTPDERLRDTHAAVPAMNPGGVGLEEPFQTPFGPLMFPPWEPECRCGVGMVFTGGIGQV